MGSLTRDSVGRGRGGGRGEWGHKLGIVLGGGGGGSLVSVVRGQSEIVNMCSGSPSTFAGCAVHYLLMFQTGHFVAGGRGRGGGAPPSKKGSIQDFKGSKITFDDSD